MPDINKPDLEKLCKGLSETFQGVLSWQWDGRFEAALSEFCVDNKDNIRALLENYLNSVWDISNIAKAPDIVQVITKGIGGLRSGQLIFTSNPSQDVFILCAWWPWGNGKTISIRIAPISKESSNPDNSELNEMFKGWFGI